MKRVQIIIFSLLLTVNLLAGIIFTGYPAFNVVLSSVTLVAQAVLLQAVHRIGLNDGFRISLSFLFFVGSVVGFLLSLFVPQHVDNNVWLILWIALLFMEIGLLAIGKYASNK